MRCVQQPRSFSCSAMQVLGTLITEWDEGRAKCEAFLGSEAAAQQAARQLAAIAAYFGFDGWLINIENKLDTVLMPHLLLFIRFDLSCGEAVSLVHTPTMYLVCRAARLEGRRGKLTGRLALPSLCCSSCELRDLAVLK